MSASTSAPTLADTLFQRGLGDLIRHLRSSPDPQTSLSRALDDSLREVRSPDLDTKSVALLKLSYLHSLHHLPLPPDAPFHALHLLPSPSPLHKRVAYLAASLSFSPLPDALLLSTHQLRKDLLSPHSLTPSLPLELLSHASSADLSRDLSPDLLPLLSSPRPFLRKKALAASPRVLSHCPPDSLRAALPRLADSLSSPDPRVLSAAVSTLAELSALDPRPFLPLAPDLHKLLLDCRNNWVLIKALKVFSRLAPLEPRLGRRIVEPVCEHLRRSPAKSLVFECIALVITHLSEYEQAVQLAVEKTREFLVEEDQNLRYLGLRGLVMLGPAHSWAVEGSREVVVRSLDNHDPNIQREALKLVMGMVCDSNVVDVCDLLVKQAARSDPEFANEILGGILTACGGNFYELIVDFEWYVSLLGEMVRNPHCAKGEEIERQLVDIGMRVKDARMELVQVARDLLIDPALLGNPFLYRVLSAAAWIAGEYVEFSRNPIELVEAVLQPRASLLPTVVRAVYIHAVFKIIVFCYGSYLEGSETGQLLYQAEPYAETRASELLDAVKLEDSTDCGLENGSEIESKYANLTCCKAESSLDLSDIKGRFDYKAISLMLDMVKSALLPWAESDEVGVQERSRNVLGLIHILQEFQSCDLEKESPVNVARVFEVVRIMQDSVLDELGPVPVNAQDRVPVPDGVALLEDLTELGAILGDNDAEMVAPSTFSLRIQCLSDTWEEAEPSTESTSLLAEHRKRHGLYYLQVENEETISSEYPQANDMVDQGNASTGKATEDLLKLTQKSLDPQKNKPVKSRPTVIKLDEENRPPISSVKTTEPKKDLWLDSLSNDRVGGEDKPASSKKKSSSKSSRRREKEAFGMVDLSHSSSRSKHHKHGKERRKDIQKAAEVTGNHGQGSSHGDVHHHHRQNGIQKEDGAFDLVSKTPVQDFLL